MAGYPSRIVDKSINKAIESMKIRSSVHLIVQMTNTLCMSDCRGLDKERRVGKGSSRFGPEKLPNYNTAGSFYHHQGLLGKSERCFAIGVEKFSCLSI